MLRCMDLESQAQIVVSKLQEWQHAKKIVVGLDGYSGVGKTTLSNIVDKLDSSIEVLSMDDYVTTACTKESLLPQIESRSPNLLLEWKPLDGISKLRESIEAYKYGPNDTKVLLVEGIFLYHPDVLNDLWDKRIYVDGDRGKADMRRIERDQIRWGDKYFPETHPDSYARLFKIADARYRELYKPKEICDLILNAG